MTTQIWTQLDDISKVAVDYLNGDHEEFDVEVIVQTSECQPLWLTRRDAGGFEIIIPWTAIRSMTVLERKEVG